MTGCIDGAGEGVEDKAVFLAVERSYEDAGIGARGIIVIDGRVKEMLSVRQEPGPTMGGVDGIVHGRNGCRTSSAGRYSKDPSVVIERGYNGAVLTPTAATSQVRVANRNRVAATGLDSLELVAD